MEPTTQNLAYLDFYLQIGGPGIVPPQEKEERSRVETLDEKFTRLIEASDQFAEGFAAGRLSTLADMAELDREHRAHRAAANWPASLDHERSYEPFSTFHLDQLTPRPGRRPYSCRCDSCLSA